MRSRRPRTALVLIAMGVVLLAAVAVGQRIGENALFSATQRRLAVPDAPLTPIPAATAADDPSLSKNWKRLQVVSVATDPAFPDPRVSPPPTPTPRPTRRPAPTPTPLPLDTSPALYTSPPLPLPLVSHEPEASPSPTPLPE